jgi:hypothetical protein
MHLSIGLTAFISVCFELTQIRCLFNSKNAMMQIISMLDLGHDSAAAGLGNGLFFLRYLISMEHPALKFYKFLTQQNP